MLDGVYSEVQADRGAATFAQSRGVGIELEPGESGCVVAKRDLLLKAMQALLETAVYDPDSGQAIAASFMDYALPRADDLPAFSLGFNPTRCTTNPLGVKGCGEAGAIAAFPAIHNAIHDALAPIGGTGTNTHFDGPATPASSSTRRLSALLAGSMIRASTSCPKTSSPPVAPARPSTR